MKIRFYVYKTFIGAAVMCSCLVTNASETPEGTIDSFYTGYMTNNPTLVENARGGESVMIDNSKYHIIDYEIVISKDISKSNLPRYKTGDKRIVVDVTVNNSQSYKYQTIHLLRKVNTEWYTIYHWYRNKPQLRERYLYVEGVDYKYLPESFTMNEDSLFRTPEMTIYSYYFGALLSR